jgi:heat shock protein HtpX
MVLTAVLTPALALALLAAIFVLAPWPIVAGVVLALAFGTTAAIHEARRRPDAIPLGAAEHPELHVMVERLCALADLGKPELVLERRREPNSWIVAAPGRRPRLHLTASLIDLLEPDELQAVLAHELSHLANGDARVMTVVGMPGAVLVRGAMFVRFGLLQIGGLVAAAVGLIAQSGSRALGRYREFSADAGACALTGRPSALASALVKVSGAVDRLPPRRDLRAAAALNAFNLVSVGTARRRRGRLGRSPIVRRLSASHPPLERRLAALERLERTLHGRVAPPLG